MNHAEIAAIFLTPSDPPIPAPVVPPTPARRLRDAAEPIATIGWWSPAAGAWFERLGLDFFGGYVWGRAAALGSDGDPAITAAAFGVFDADLLAGVLGPARAIADRATILEARAAGAAEGLRTAAPEVDHADVAEAAALLTAALDAVDGAGRALFSGLRSLPRPTDPHGALWRAAEVYREHRGDGHLAACVAAGLDAVEMNVLTELWLGYPVGEYSSTRGFGPDRLAAAVAGFERRGWVADGVLTADGRAAREVIEAATDDSQQAVLDALGADVDPVLSVLDDVGAAVLTAHAAPADPRKRAAG